MHGKMVHHPIKTVSDVVPILVQLTKQIQEHFLSKDV